MDLLKRQAMNVFVILALLCGPFGFGMAVYMNNAYWLWACLPLIIFLS